MSEGYERGFLTIENSELKQPLIQMITYGFRHETERFEPYFSSLEEVDLKKLGLFAVSIFELIVKRRPSMGGIRSEFGLSDSRLEEHLENLSSNGLIKEDEKSRQYLATEKGEEFWKILTDDVVSDLVRGAPLFVNPEEDGF